MSILKSQFLSHYGLRKSAPHLGLFVKYVFPFHGLSMEDFFRYAPALTFIEATIYQLDDFLERAQKRPEGTPRQAFEDVRDRIADFLDELGCYDEKIAFELEEMVTYCHLEMRLMRSGALSSVEGPNEADLQRALELRTIDLRILHRVLFRLRGTDYDESLMAFFRPVEARWDVEEDLDQYVDDVHEDSFNIYRMYARVYGDDARQRLAATIDELEQEALERLAALPARRQQLARTLYRRYRAEKPATPIPELIPELIPETEMVA